MTPSNLPLTCTPSEYEKGKNMNTKDNYNCYSSDKSCSVCSFVWDSIWEDLYCRLFPDRCLKCGGTLQSYNVDSFYYKKQCENGHSPNPLYRLRDDRPGKI